MLERDKCDWIEGMIGACTIMILTINEWRVFGKAHLSKGTRKRYIYEAS